MKRSSESMRLHYVLRRKRQMKKLSEIAQKIYEDYKEGKYDPNDYLDYEEKYVRKHVGGHYANEQDYDLVEVEDYD